MRRSKLLLCHSKLLLCRGELLLTCRELLVLRLQCGPLRLLVLHDSSQKEVR
jgi:hypothetical protein